MPRKRQRREKGSGSIYKSGDQWVAQRERAAIDGKRRYERRYFRRKVEAVRQVATWAEEAAALAQHAQAGDTLRAWCVSWIATKRDSVVPRTLKHYSRHLGYATALIGDIRLFDLTAQHVRDMLSVLATSDLAPRSRAHVLTILRMALQLAVDDGALARNPCATVDPPKVTKYEAVALTPAQLDTLYAAAQGSRFQILWKLLGTFGMRLGEALALRWPDYDHTARRLRVRATKTDTERYLPLLDEDVDLLDQQWQRLQIERADNPRWKEHGLILPSEVGTPLGQPNARRAFKIALERAGLSRAVRIHDLRHSAATNLLAAGVDIPTVQYLTGHRDSAVLLDIYGHTANDRTREAIERVRKRG